MWIIITRCKLVVLSNYYRNIENRERVEKIVKEKTEKASFFGKFLSFFKKKKKTSIIKEDRLLES